MFGPLKDRKIELPDQPIILGRERTNEVYISDLLLSRRHCSIEKNKNYFLIRDLQSRNGVFVNGVPVRERTLNHGDRIEIGTSTFLFLTHEEQSRFDDSSVLDDSLQAESTLSLKAEDSRYLKDTPAANSARVYLRIGQAFKAGNDVSAFSKKLLESISELIPYERAVLLDIESLKAIGSNLIKGSALRQFSKSLCEKAISEKVGTLASKFTLPESISGSMIESVLCVPFVWLNRVLCLLYMDTSNGSNKFTEDHLQIASAIASLSSPVFYHLQEAEKLQEQNVELQQKLLGNKTIIGESAEIRKVLDMISRIGRANTTVLITGESGTGKELAARAIHAASSKPGSPFVAINCAAIPESLLESELFGYEKGAFTGAVNQKKGKIELANGGTLFLDEIGELDPLLQAKLLRVLQEHEFERVGGTNPIKIDVRIIAATNRSLEKSIEEGKFRSDLYYRLNVIRLKMPPLRELGDDILLLAQYFISMYTAKIGRRVHGLSNDAKECLLKYDWPGNIRELQNTIERAVALGTSEWIELEDLPEPLLEKRPIPSNPNNLSFQDALLQLKRDLILKAFEGTKGNFNEAASRLGLNPNHLYRLVKNLNLKDEI
jgi:transcriptional regulator with GAF, ATPase, and Fis domain